MSDLKKNDDEINLFHLVKAFWDGKWVIIILTIVSFAISWYFNSKKPESFKVVTALSPSDNSTFIKYISLNQILKSNRLSLSDENETNIGMSSSTVFKRFLFEFSDYEEMVDVIDDEGIVSKSLDENKRQEYLFSIARKFIIFNHTKNIKGEPDEWHIMFNWDDVAQGKKLFDKALLKTLENVKSRIYNDISVLANVIDMEKARELDRLNSKIKNSNKILDLENQKRILFLEEQSALAKELGIEVNTLDNNTLTRSDTNNASISIDSKENPYYSRGLKVIPYYLRGYKVIDKEIELIKNRKENNMSSDNYDDYLRTVATINYLKSDLSSAQLREMLIILEKDNPQNWVNFSFKLATIESQKRSKLTLILGAFYGLVSGVLLILISLVVRFNKALVKKI